MRFLNCWRLMTNSSHKPTCVQTFRFVIRNSKTNQLDAYLQSFLCEFLFDKKTSPRLFSFEESEAIGFWGGDSL